MGLFVSGVQEGAGQLAIDVLAFGQDGLPGDLFLRLDICCLGFRLFYPSQTKRWEVITNVASTFMTACSRSFLEVNHHRYSSSGVEAMFFDTLFGETILHDCPVKVLLNDASIDKINVIASLPQDENLVQNVCHRGRTLFTTLLLFLEVFDHVSTPLPTFLIDCSLIGVQIKPLLYLVPRRELESFFLVRLWILSFA